MWETGLFAAQFPVLLELTGRFPHNIQSFPLEIKAAGLFSRGKSAGKYEKTKRVVTQHNIGEWKNVIVMSFHQ